MTRTRAVLLSRVRDDRGATAVEYGIMVAFVAAVIIAVVATLGLDLVPGFTTVEGRLPGAN